MAVGEAVWMSGHIGIYIGDGLAVECSPKWENKVQITAVGNIGSKAGYNTRTWTKHGKLPYVDYSESGTTTGGGTATKPDTGGATIYKVAAGDNLSKIAAKYGTTYQKLAAYNGITNPNIIRVGQKIKIPGTAAPKKTNAEIAKEVIAGKWGNGADRKKRLEAAGYDYNAIQQAVNAALAR